MLVHHLIPTLALLVASSQAARIQVRTFSENTRSTVGLPDPKLPPTERWFELGPDRRVELGTELHISVAVGTLLEQVMGQPRSLKQPACSFEGRLDDGVDEIAFVIAYDASYLHPCGSNHGITIACSNPLTVCPAKTNGIPAVIEVTPARTVAPKA